MHLGWEKVMPPKRPPRPNGDSEHQHLWDFVYRLDRRIDSLFLALLTIGGGVVATLIAVILTQ